MNDQLDIDFISLIDRDVRSEFKEEVVQKEASLMSEMTNEEVTYISLFVFVGLGGAILFFNIRESIYSMIRGTS